MFSSEDRTPSIQAWRSGLRADEVWMSEWNITEFYSAMSFKRRTQQMSLPQRADAQALFEGYLREFPNVFSVTSANFHRAGEIAGRDDINIRAADALHLAVAEAHVATICTLDRKMQQAAGPIGIGWLVP